MAKGKRKRSRERKVSAAEVSAAAAVITAIVACIALAASLGGAADAIEAVHIGIVDEPLVSDRWVVPGDVEAKPLSAGACTQSDLLERRRWFVDHGGVPTEFTVDRVDVVNDSGSTLLVEGLQLSKVEELPAVQGKNYALCPRGGGGAVEDQYVAIDFDHRPPQLQFFNETYEHVRAIDFSPSPHQPLRFWILAGSSTKRYRWKMTLVYSLDGEIHRAQIPEGGRPFDITG